MTQGAVDVIILPDEFRNSIEIHMHQSGIFRIGVLKKMEKSKPLFGRNAISKFRSTFPKMGRKN
jgi:hypothetical protein